MTQSADPTEPRYALVTFHGSLVYFDRDLGCLRHAPIGRCEANVHLTRDGATAVLSWLDGTQARPLNDFRPDACGFVEHGARGALTADTVGPDIVALHASGRYLCAEASGTVTLSRFKPKDWESFLLVAPEDVERLTFVLTNRWLCRLTGAITSPSAYRCAERWSVAFDRIRVGIPELVRAVREGSGGEALPRAFFLVFEDWKLRHYLLYRPLVYLVGYGKESIFQCAEIAIRSLFEFGGWDGDVLLLTDPEHRDFPNRFPPGIRERVSVSMVPAHDLLDYNIARYKIVDLPEAEMYQPVIYIDTDVVCDANLLELTVSATVSFGLHACPEFPLAQPGDYYGQSLLTADGIQFDPNQRGYSSGVLAFKNTPEQRLLFRTIADATYRVATLADRRDVFEYFEQPFLNYVTFQSKSIGGGLLSKFVRIYLNHQPTLNEPLRIGLVHFAGGVGNTVPKLTHMTNYVALLARDKSAITPAPGQG